MSRTRSNPVNPVPAAIPVPFPNPVPAADPIPVNPVTAAIPVPLPNPIPAADPIPVNPVPAAFPVPLPNPVPAADPIPPSVLAQPWWLVALASIVALTITVVMIFSGKENIEVVTKLIVELAKIIKEFFSEVIRGIFSAGVIVKDSGFIAVSTIYNDFSVNKLVILCAVAVFFPMMGEMVQKLLAKPPK